MSIFGTTVSDLRVREAVLRLFQHRDLWHDAEALSKALDGLAGKNKPDQLRARLYRLAASLYDVSEVLDALDGLDWFLLKRTGRRHELKTWPDSFEAIWRRVKHAEFRKDDRGGFQVGDVLVLREFVREPCTAQDPATGQKTEGTAEYYTQRSIEAVVTHVVRGPVYGVPDGFAMLSIEPFFFQS